MLRIHDILVWIRILLFSSLSFKTPTKNLFVKTVFLYITFFKLHLHHFSKIKSQKKSQNSRNQGFPYYFWWIREGSGSGAGSKLTDPDPGGPKTCGAGGSGFGSATLEKGQSHEMELSLRSPWVNLYLLPVVCWWFFRIVQNVKGLLVVNLIRLSL